MHKLKALAMVPALLSGTGADAGASFDVSSLVQTVITSAQTQLLSALGIIAASAGVITVAVVGVKFALRWVKRLGAA